MNPEVHPICFLEQALFIICHISPFSNSQALHATPSQVNLSSGQRRTLLPSASFKCYQGQEALTPSACTPIVSGRPH
eukprot:356160-Pelagomonas_calceolata.AAC.1